jgi:hypothetical protein
MSAAASDAVNNTPVKVTPGAVSQPGEVPASPLGQASTPGLDNTPGAWSTVSEVTHTNEWATVTETDADDVKTTAFIKRVMKSMLCIMKDYGGPYEFIRHELMLDADAPLALEKSTKLKNEFAEWLWTEFPEKQDFHYHHDSLLPSTTEKDMAHSLPLTIHLSSLAYNQLASVKPPPGQDVFLSLVERYMIDGFVTSSEPGLIVQPDSLAHQPLIELPPCDNRNQLKVASIGYIKFWSRTCSLMTFLLWVKKNNVNLQREHAMLYESLLCIYVHHVPQDTKVDEALVNLTKSAAGSIRRAPNTISIIMIIFNLLQAGALQDYSEFVRRWNRKSGSASAIQGKRATALKFLFELAPREAVIIMYNHIGKMSQGSSAWSDDNIASKKLFPGHSFSAKCKKWAARIRVTDDSFIMWLKFIQKAHEAKPKKEVRRNDLSENISLAEQAAAVWHLGQELLLAVPIKHEDMQMLDWKSVGICGGLL